MVGARTGALKTIYAKARANGDLTPAGEFSLDMADSKDPENVDARFGRGTMSTHFAPGKHLAYLGEYEKHLASELPSKKASESLDDLCMEKTATVVIRNTKGTRDMVEEMQETRRAQVVDEGEFDAPGEAVVREPGEEG